MPNRQLTPKELVDANAILAEIRVRIAACAGGDRELLFALRRKVFKELTYDERGKPMHRVKLKAAKRKAQGNLCAVCSQPLADAYTVLDRLTACDGYTAENTRVICEPCDRKVQVERGYA
jgi:hypothetical protein